MFYDIGSVTNRNIQLLYEYRILREPSHNLTAICRDGNKQTIDTLNWKESTREIEGYDTVYEARLDGIKPEADCVPFLEFHPEENSDWKWIADFIDVQVDDEGVTLYSSTNYIDVLPTDVYWCYSLRHIDSLLTDILDDLGGLVKEYDKLENEIKNYRDDGRYLRRPAGLIPNLVKIQNTEEGSDLVDSLYQVMTAESNRLFVNMSQDNLNHMEHIFNESVEFRFINQDHYVVDSFIAPVILISGNGSLVLRNLKGQVLVTNWSGSITVIDCPEVHLTATNPVYICRLNILQISKGSTVYLENQVHIIKELRMYANSLCRHWRGNVRNLTYVGPGCTYWCCAQVSVPGRAQLSEYTDASNTVFDFNVHNIIGSFVSDFDNMMIVGQKNLTPRLGNSDAEPQPGMYVSKWKAKYNSYIPDGSGGGSKSEITIDGLTCWLWLPNSHENVGLILCVPGAQGGVDEATVNFGAWMAVDEVRPRAACLFLQRPDDSTLPSKDAVLQKIQELQTQYHLGSDLWYYGFAAGANEYPTLSTWTTFKGAVLIDCDNENDCNFSTAGMEKLMVVQGSTTFGYAYEKYRNVVSEFIMYDYQGEYSSASVNYWTPSDTDQTYREIIEGHGTYQKLPDNPPNGLIWLCGGQALPDSDDTAGSGYYLIDPISTSSLYYYHPLGSFAQHYIDGDVGYNVFPHTYGNHGWGKLDWGVGANVPVYSMTNGTITSVNCRNTSDQLGYVVVIRTDRVDSTGDEIYIRYLEMAGLGDIAANVAGITPGPGTFNYQQFTHSCEVPIKRGDLIGYTNSFYSDYSNLHLDFTYGDNYVNKGGKVNFNSPDGVPHVIDGATLNPAFEIRSGLVYCNGNRLGTANGKVLDRYGSETAYTVYPEVSFMVCLQKPIKID